MAVGYVDNLSKGPQAPSSWRARAVPLKYWDILVQMAVEGKHQSEHAANVFKQVLDDPESKDLGKMQEYLLEIGVAFGDGEDEDAAQVKGEQTGNVLAGLP
ncbi:predicted protein [Chaetomium globosum CBS 148.51]|uniref:Uncharacterized protein n=1 Tax=Chaetomium globosum (strain ATCC 6205 / CBS 148.51 / DSM 1962 / NBRC 6347 / NRRL 1970) TaxID=306901 RepID=Q2HI07_CHAGB|nr:uncharacterized protein CHGG_00147 [Chaetomium globosum CBS 148.51]EAQ91912.1 predicted protein [Chaetomium globosum CBS 148.51]